MTAKKQPKGSRNVQQGVPDLKSEKQCFQTASSGHDAAFTFKLPAKLHDGGGDHSWNAFEYDVALLHVAYRLVVRVSVQAVDDELLQRLRAIIGNTGCMFAKDTALQLALRPYVGGSTMGSNGTCQQPRHSLIKVG